MGKRRAQNRGNATDRLVRSERPLGEDGGSAVGVRDDLDDFNEEHAARSGDDRFDAGRQLRRGTDAVVQNPLGLALGGLALGFLAGLAFPISDVERDKLGDVGDSIADQVQTQVQAISQDVVQHGKAVLAETLQAAVVDGKNPVEAAQQSAAEHLTTVAQNAQSRVEESLKSSSS